MRDFAINIIALLGVTLVIFSLWLIFKPLAFMGAGAALIILAYGMARADEYRKRTTR